MKARKGNDVETLLSLSYVFATRLTIKIKPFFSIFYFPISPYKLLRYAILLDVF